MNDEQWMNVFGSEPGGSTAAVGVDSPGITRNAQSGSDTSLIPVPPELNFAATENAEHDAERDKQGNFAATENAYVVTPDMPVANFAAPKKRGRPANGDKLQRAVVHLPPGVLSALPADHTVAEHVRRAVAMYVERMAKPTEANSPTAQSITLNADQLAAIESLCITPAQRQRLIELANAHRDAPARDALGLMLKWYG